MGIKGSQKYLTKNKLSKDLKYLGTIENKTIHCDGAPFLALSINKYSTSNSIYQTLVQNAIDRIQQFIDLRFENIYFYLDGFGNSDDNGSDIKEREDPRKSDLDNFMSTGGDYHLHVWAFEALFHKLVAYGEKLNVNIEFKRSISEADEDVMDHSNKFQVDGTHKYVFGDVDYAFMGDLSQKLIVIYYDQKDKRLKWFDRFELFKKMFGDKYKEKTILSFIQITKNDYNRGTGIDMNEAIKLAKSNSGTDSDIYSKIKDIYSLTSLEEKVVRFKDNGMAKCYTDYTDYLYPDFLINRTKFLSDAKKGYCYKTLVDKLGDNSFTDQEVKTFFKAIFYQHNGVVSLVAEKIL
ncbi:hypothetical protein DFA_00618 [Cavenderia fasciculata]|uniref:Uncharacterized protein n=1 Tax=Cavenderia fasciculata TaxID=261658 RepID=F4PSW6_CACFS|nr:uncharacterized protein DFA_00618 [Cavenderia fasciculata]EGG20755.1 hypothetical protein DFA_00618 [Cavenderia fasciculata]|eukprot:XP_004358605.1 hypothetical protein DFA_00618 [Cavenderia fasciculata]